MQVVSRCKVFIINNFVQVSKLCFKKKRQKSHFIGKSFRNAITSICRQFEGFNRLLLCLIMIINGQQFQPISGFHDPAKTISKLLPHLLIIKEVSGQDCV